VHENGIKEKQMIKSDKYTISITVEDGKVAHRRLTYVVADGELEKADMIEIAPIAALDKAVLALVPSTQVSKVIAEKI